MGLQGLLNKIDRYSADIATFQALAAEVADLPADQLERALVVAASLPKAASETLTAGALKKVRAPFLDALAVRTPSLEKWLKEVNLSKVFADPPMDGPDKAYDKLLKVVDATSSVHGIDSGRFALATMELWFSGQADTALLQGALARVPSIAAFAAYQRAYEHRQTSLFWRANLELDGEMLPGIGQLRDLEGMTLTGKHTGTAHLDEMTTFAPFRLNYFVRSPKLANLLPIRNQLKTLAVKRCADFSAVLQFEKLEQIVLYAPEDLPNAFATLGHLPQLMIATLSTASDIEGAAALRATYMK